MVQNTMRALPGSLSGGRSTMAEKSARWLGSMGLDIVKLPYVIPGFAPSARPGMTSRRCRHAQADEALLRRLVVHELGRWCPVRDRAALQHDGVARQLQRHVGVLLDQHDGDLAVGEQQVDRLDQLLDDDGG